MDDLIKSHCNLCGRETKHAARAAFVGAQVDFVDDQGRDAEIRTTFQILQCLGCDELSLRVDAEHDAYGTASPEFYPPRIRRPRPRWADKLPSSILYMLEEVYRALQTGSPRLATIGARTVIDLVIVDKVGDVGTFSQKLSALEGLGYVGSLNREFVDAALDTGSAAAHRGIAPKSEDLNRVMDIVESLLESVYVLGDAATRLREVTPARPPRTKGPGPSGKPN